MPEFTAAAVARALEGASAETQRAIQEGAETAARDLARQLRGLYPRGPTGNLRSSVRVQPRPGGWMVRATAPHIHIWEEGTRPRYDPTRANAYRGISPAFGPVFVPAAIAERTEWLEAAARLLALEVEL